MVCGSIFHFHQSPRLRPTPYGESQPLEHQPLDAAAARLGAQIGEGVPADRREPRRALQRGDRRCRRIGRIVVERQQGVDAWPGRDRGARCGVGHGDCGLEQRPAVGQGHAAHVDGVVLEDVVGHEDDRDVARLARHLLLTADALLQRRERQRPIVADRRAPRRRARCRRAGRAAASLISGKRSVISSSPRDQRWTCPPRLTSCARMPSHFHSTSQRSRSPSVRAMSSAPVTSWSIGEARKNGYGRERSLAVAPGASSDAYHDGRRRPVAHQPRRHRRRRQRRRLRQRAHDQRLRDADAQLAGQQLQQA